MNRIECQRDFAFNSSLFLAVKGKLTEHAIHCFGHSQNVVEYPLNSFNLHFQANACHSASEICRRTSVSRSTVFYQSFQAI